jgi:RNA-directed DNA polymerase
LREFSLSLLPDKTRLIEFGRFATVRRARCGVGKPETFNFLGFSVLQRHEERRATQSRKQCRKAA